MDENLEQAVSVVKERMTGIMKWMKMSGLKINIAKTEVCVFHRHNLVQIKLELNGIIITSKRTINVLGITFVSTMKWDAHVNKAISESSTSLHAIGISGSTLNQQK